MNRPNDAGLVRQTQDLVSEITWDAEIRTRFRDSNLGLRRAVVDAVTWANSEYGKVVVLEDDVRAGTQLLDFLNYNLIGHEANQKIAHINGYNLVHKEHLTNPDHASRLSIYPDSYAWATWDRAWQKYDDSLIWAQNTSVQDIKNICGSTIGALRWKQNFGDAAAERIDTWAYRWLASMWEHNWLMVSPNRNIATYAGWEGGTHTRRKPKWTELPINDIHFIDEVTTIEHVMMDAAADAWLGKKVFGESLSGLAEGVAATMAMSVLKHQPRHQKKLIL
jgi:hypothetical protein